MTAYLVEDQACRPQARRSAAPPGDAPSARKVVEACRKESRHNNFASSGGKQRRLRREDGRRYEVYYEDLSPNQIGWWEEVPTVTPATAIAQCISHGTPTYILRQALERARQQGRITGPEHDDLAARLEVRDG